MSRPRIFSEEEVKQRRKERHRINYPKIKDEKNRKLREWGEAHPEEKMLRQAKSRANVFGLDFNITVEDLVIPKLCPVLGEPIDRTAPRSRLSPTIDRIDNSKGYIKGNVTVISHQANTWKSNMTINDMQKLITYMENFS